ncbi:MAG TPA: hypothetical protein VEA69_21080 [Tepidisphaeraceae bacterium]|nr:hypothetical protein [Tepidisphaeraceae bacterium]
MAEVLTAEQVELLRGVHGAMWVSTNDARRYIRVKHLCDSHESLRAEAGAAKRSMMSVAFNALGGDDEDARIIAGEAILADMVKERTADLESRLAEATRRAEEAVRDLTAAKADRHRLIQAANKVIHHNGSKEELNQVVGEVCGNS